MLNKTLCILFSLLLFSTAASALEKHDDVTLAAVQVLSAEGKSEEAFAMLQQLVITTPENFQAWFFLGAEQAKRRQFHDAIVSFGKVVELQPRLAEPHNNLAVIYNELGDLRPAVTELEASLELNPDYATAHENIGDMYVKLAAESYHKALAKKPNKSLRLRYEYLLHIREADSVARMNASIERATPEHDIKEEAVTEAVAFVQKQVQQKPEQATVDSSADATSPQEPQSSRPAIAEQNPAEGTATAINKPKNQGVKADATSSQPKQQPDLQTAAEQTGTTTRQNIKGDILQAIEAWRTAWNKRDALAYFAAYDPDFKQGTRFLSHNDWIGYKLQVIIKKKFIHVSLENIQVTRVSADLAKVVFLQHYRSDIFVSDDQKEMRLKKTTNGWKIVHEKSL